MRLRGKLEIHDGKGGMITKLWQFNKTGADSFDSAEIERTLCKCLREALRDLRVLAADAP